MEYKKNEGISNKKEIITQESLQPQRILKGEKAYQSVCDIAERLKKGDATNIALTGPYGSGKSSILITLKEDYSNYSYLNISLATLKPSEAIATGKTSDDKDDKLSKQNLDRLIEYSILQQLIYKEKQETLPNSRFKRIFHLPTDRVIKVTVAVILAVIAFIIVFEPAFLRVEWLCKLLGQEWMNITGDVVSIVYLLFFAYKAIAMIVPAISDSRLNKLNLKDGEIEIVKNTSIFNKHLDEILYFFERTKYDVVLLEDLDRFESTDIFLKLRELNLLLNESKVVGRKIYFVYAVRDDMFQDMERVKCFDYITTVIPIINRSNAKSQLKEELEKRGVTEIKDTTLRELGFFLHDMRLLKNIANEYVQYRGKLEKGISGDKLLGMIVYKNYFPKDFTDLHNCNGIVYQLLNLKEIFVRERIAELETETERRQERVVAYQQERHLKEKELRRIYIEAYRDKIGNNVISLKVGDGMYSFNDIASNEKLFDKLIADSSVIYLYNVYVNYSVRTQQKTITLPFTDIEKFVDPSKTYRERIDLLRTDFASLADDGSVEIKKEDIHSQILSQLMSCIDYNSMEEYKKLKVPRMIEYLVVKGYLDENYYDYISYFYANFIDAHDWDFVLDLKLGKGHPYDYHVNNVDACLTEIPKSVYRKSIILNIDLVDYLATYLKDRLNAMRLMVIIRTIIDEGKYDFLSEYYQKGKCQDEVFGLLFSRHKNLWGVLEKNDDDKQSLRQSWYKYAEMEQGCEESKKWINEHYGFITDHLLDIKTEQWCMLIMTGKYQFTELNTISGDILKAVVETNSYTLTRHNVEILVRILLDMTIESVSYSLVNQTEDKQLIRRVEENLGECMNTVFAAPESEKENVNTIIGILLSTRATEDEKIAYLKKQQSRLDFETIEQNDLKTLALKCDVIEPSWKNVIHYMNNVSEQKTNEELVKYIEQYADIFAEEKILQETEDHERMLLYQLIMTDVLTFEIYKKIVIQFTRWQLARVPNIEKRRVLLLIENGMLPFKEENTKDLLSKYSEQEVVTYLLRNKHEFLVAPDTVVFTTAVAIGLMRSELTVREKASLLPHFNKEIIDSDLADELIAVLNQHEVTLDFNILLKVMSLTKKTDMKLHVLNYTLEKNDFVEDTITTFLNTLPYPYKYIAEKGKKPELPNTAEDWRLVRTLEAKGYISSYSETKKGIRVNTKLK